MTIDERVAALALANKLLDEPYADPDDDLRMLSRQLIRLEEMAEKRADKIHQLRDALAMAWREIVASGNERAQDYDWPKVRKAVFDALEITDG